LFLAVAIYQDVRAAIDLVSFTARKQDEFILVEWETASEFDVAGLNKEFSRTTYYLLDTGTLPTGNTRQQIGKSQEVNFDVKNILNQSIMRYNQLYSSMITVTIAGDFSLHAGDVVYVDVPELSADTKNDQVSKQSGGLYIISDLCHYVTTKGTFTKLNLVRDSFGRTGNHTTNRS